MENKNDDRKIKSDWPKTKKCPHCFKEININAKKCPHCQFDLRSWLSRYPILSKLLIALVIVFIIIVSLNSGSTTPNNSSNTNTPVVQPTICGSYNEAAAKTVSYKELEKDPDSLSGTSAKFTGQVVEIEESNGVGVIRLSVTKEDYGWSSSDIIWVDYTGHNDFVNNDIVDVYGLIEGSHTYTSQANYQITLPAMNGCIIQKPKAVAATTSSIVTETKKIEANAPAIGKAIENTVPKSWHTVATYSINSSTQTSPFSMQGSEWRISYTCSVVDTTRDSGAFNGSVDNASDGSMANFFAEDVTTCPTSNTSYVYAQTPGQYYLDITPFNAFVGVTVEDYY